MFQSNSRMTYFNIIIFETSVSIPLLEKKVTLFVKNALFVAYNTHFHHFFATIVQIMYAKANFFNVLNIVQPYQFCFFKNENIRKKSWHREFDWIWLICCSLSWFPNWPNGWVFVYELSGSGFQSSFSHLNLRFRACFEQGVPGDSGNYRVWIDSETRTWHEHTVK